MEVIQIETWLLLIKFSKKLKFLIGHEKLILFLYTHVYLKAFCAGYDTYNRK